MPSLKGVVVAAAGAVGIDLIRFGSVRHPVGRRARMMAALGIDMVIDVGANTGLFGQEIRRRGYAGQIVSIEPLGAPFRELSRVAERDARWTAIRSAVGARTGSATMHVAANAGASSSILPMLTLHARTAPEALYVAEESVDVATLDDLVQPLLRDEASVFVKIDVQGFELEVLRGAQMTLERSSVVQLEMSFLPLYESAPTYLDLLEFMTQRGFQLVGLEPGIATPAGLLLQADGLFATVGATRALQSAG